MGDSKDEGSGGVLRKALKGDTVGECREGSKTGPHTRTLFADRDLVCLGIFPVLYQTFCVSKYGTRTVDRERTRQQSLSTKPP